MQNHAEIIEQTKNPINKYKKGNKDKINNIILYPKTNITV